MYRPANSLPVTRPQTLTPTDAAERVQYYTDLAVWAAQEDLPLVYQESRKWLTEALEQLVRELE